MALIHSFICFLSFVFTLVHAAPWIVTGYYEQDVYTQDSYYYGSEVVTTVTQFSPTATLPAEALSTITSTDTSYDSYTIVEKLYPTGYGVEKDSDSYLGYYSLDTDGNYHTTLYKVNVTYSAPTGCSTQWTTTSAVEVTPPAEVRNLLPKGTVASSTSIDNSQPFQPTTYLYDVVFVDPTQVPSADLSSASYYNKPTASYNGVGCQYTGDSSSGYYGGYYYGDYDYDNWFTSKWGMGIGISGLALVLITTLGWAGLFFFLGMIEAWVRFRRLMTGWQTRRGFPLFWAFSCFPISLFFLFCFRKGFRARSREDADILKQRWDAMGFGTKLRLYFVWGFRFKYPTVLGPAPPRVAGNKKPSESGPRLLETPPATAAPSAAPSRDGSERAPEMAQASGGLSEAQRDAEIGQAR